MDTDLYATETWKVIPGFESYMASDMGRVRKIRRKPLTPVKTQYGYHQCTICHNGQRYTRFIHRLVAAAFIGPQPTPEHDVLHWDGGRTNNSLSNLRWGTPKENNQDQERHGVRIKGETHPHAKLNDTLVREMRRRFKDGEQIMSIWRSNPVVNYRVTWNAIHGKTWSHVK